MPTGTGPARNPISKQGNRCHMKPMQVKIFYDGGHIPSDRFESVISSLSRKINEWLQENPDIEIVTILQSESQGTENAWNLTLTVFYRL